GLARRAPERVEGARLDGDPARLFGVMHEASMGYARAVFEEDEHTMMVPAFAEGSFFADRYRLDSLIGSGAMGRVYEAVELHSSRRVALKVLHRERLGEPDTVERFEREAEVLASIGHPCIVEIFTFHRTSDGTPYLAMELL
ncbi:MAG TPA: hypothetical protein DEF51_06480, partial [Myxococcales bacterium]|nr:hypothetical protein [Myxococcales bacterium]